MADAREPLLANGGDGPGNKPHRRMMHNVSVLRFSYSNKEEPSSTYLTYLDPRPSWQSQIDLASLLIALFPCIKYLKGYNTSFLRADVLAGLTVGVMLVPQSMAYARIAGLPPQFGLYTSLVPCLAYAVFGSSRQVMVGPVSLVSLLVAEGLAPWSHPDKLLPDDKDLYQKLAVLLAFMVGVLKACCGLLRMGWVVRFLSHSVVSGFTSGAAIIIGLEQTRYWMDCKLPRHSTLHLIVKDIYNNIGNINLATFIMGSSALVALLTMKHLGKSRKRFRLLRAIGPLMAVVLGTLYVWRTGMKTKTIGEVPKGLPKLSLQYPWEYVERLLLPALVIIGVGCLESISIAKALAAKNCYELDANQELLGLGLANLLGSMFSAFPAYGSFSRSAVNDDSGAKTGLAGLVTGLLVLCTLQFFTPLLVHLPMAILASIVINSVIGLVDFQEARFLYKVDEKDFLLWMMAFLGTMFLGVQIGVLVSIIVSLAFVVNESANPHTAVLGRLPGTTVYRNIEQFPDAITTEGIMALRIDAPIYFANVPFIKDFLRQYEHGQGLKVEPEGSRSVPLQYVVLQMSPVSAIDCTGCHALVTIYTEYRERGIQFAIVNPNRVVMRTLERAGIPDLIGRQWFFVSVHDAVQVCLAHMAVRSGAQDPLENAVPSKPTPARSTPPPNLLSETLAESEGRVGCKHVLLEEATLLQRRNTFSGVNEDGLTFARRSTSEQRSLSLRDYVIEVEARTL